MCVLRPHIVDGFIPGGLGMGLVFLHLTLVGICLVPPFLGSHGNLLYGLLTTKDASQLQVCVCEEVVTLVEETPLPLTGPVSGGSQSAADLSVESEKYSMM